MAQEAHEVQRTSSEGQKVIEDRFGQFEAVGCNQAAIWEGEECATGRKHVDGATGKQRRGSLTQGREGSQYGTSSQQQSCKGKVHRKKEKKNRQMSVLGR